jgi:hypothetical protein
MKGNFYQYPLVKERKERLWRTTGGVEPINRQKYVRKVDQELRKNGNHITLIIAIISDRSLASRFTTILHIHSLLLPASLHLWSLQRKRMVLLSRHWIGSTHLQNLCNSRIYFSLEWISGALLIVPSVVHSFQTFTPVKITKGRSIRKVW